MAQNDTDTKELTRLQWKAIPALVTARTIEDAAKETGISLRTLHRWLQEPHFAAALSAAESSAIDYAVRRLLQLQDKAIDAITTALDDPKPTIRLRAAALALDTLMRLRELRNVEARLLALERLYAQP